MAEYNLSMEDIISFVGEKIEESPEKENLNAYKASILVALTTHGDSVQDVEIPERLSLWENQLQRPSELVIGNKYIRIQSAVIAFVGDALASGFLDMVITKLLQDPIGMSVSVGGFIVVSIKSLLDSICTLEDFDFCVYRQAVAHFKTHKEFTKEELANWFPHEGIRTCNMHNSKWDCDLIENDQCTMLLNGNLDRALESLCAKEVLSHEKKSGLYYYKFKY